MKNMNESILDPVQKTRCPEIFDSNDIMHKAVADHIKNAFKLWYEQLNPELKTFDIVGYKMIGSSSGFQYTDTSDIDLQVIIRMHNGIDFKETWKLIKILPNGHNLKGTNHPINYFLVDEKNPTDLEKVENLYNLETKKWEKKSEKPNLVIPSAYIKEITRFFTDGFDLLLGRYERDKEYFIASQKLNPERQEISEKEKQEEIDRCLTQLKEDIDALWLAEHIIHGFRLEAYDENKPFHLMINYMSDDPRGSSNELIYKTLDKFEYREKLRAKAKEGTELIKKYTPETLDEDYSDLFSDVLNESEFSDDYSAMFDEIEDASESEKIKDVLDILKDIQYGFISKKDGSRIVDREWIHTCPDLDDYYTVATDPEETLKNKLGICIDQCLAQKYLFSKMHPDMETELYALTKGPFGHCIFTFKDCDKYYYLENAWDKEKGMHGPFNSKEDLENHLCMLYHKHHDKDNSWPVNISTYEEYLKNRSLTESVIIF